MKKKLPKMTGTLGGIYQNILDNSWVKQEAFAFSASLVLLSTLTSRKIVFQGLSPNLYILNVAPSGSGKDLPQQILKKYLTDINAMDLLGAGDYVSDAALMDGLAVKPTRLDIMDEAGGILKSITSGGAEYNGKMADILAELYTSSNSRYLGRATAEGTKGACYRPNVNILASTTPTGLSEGVSLRSIEKGLMGRFLIFLGDYDKPAVRLREFPRLDPTVNTVLKFWREYKPEESSSHAINGIEQQVTELSVDDEANKALDDAFDSFDKLRRGADPTSPLMPIIARLYQQMVKITMLHAVSRQGRGIPVIKKVDVEFGLATILYYFDTVQDVIDKYIFGNTQEKEVVKMREVIREFPDGIDSASLSRKTRGVSKKRREEIIQELIESGEVVADFTQTPEGKTLRVYRGVQ